MAEKSRFMMAAKVLASLNTYGETNNAQNTIDNALLPITSEPSSVMAGHAIASFWEFIPVMWHDEAASTLELAIQCQNIMLINHTVWKWLNVTCMDNCWSHICSCGPSDNWIKRLTDRVDNVIDTRSAMECTISLEDFLPGLNAAAFKWRRSQHSNILFGEKCSIVIFNTVTAIVRQWLGYPIAGVLQAQAIFVDDIIKTMGVDVLLLDVLWTSYCKLNTFIISKPTFGTIIEQHFDKF